MPNSKILSVLIVCSALVGGAFLVTKAPKAETQKTQDLSAISEKSLSNENLAINDDWKKILVGVDLKNEKIIDLTKNNPDAFDGTSLTGQMARDYFSQYLLAKQGGKDVTETDINKIVQNVLSNPEYTKSTGAVYIRSNLNISSNSNLDTVKKYKDKITKEVVQKIGKTRNPISVNSSNQGINENDVSKFDPLIITGREIVQSLLQIEVPSDVVKMHLLLLNSANSALSDLEALRVMFTDPIKSLSAGQQFMRDTIEFQTNINNIQAYFKYKNI